jgi:hypothetical protein
VQTARLAGAALIIAVDPIDAACQRALVGWRYIPNIGRPGAALSHATLFPQDLVTGAAWLGEGRIH